MTDNLENLAIEELAITNPTAYINSNPSPREWTMTPQDIARSLKLTAEDFKNLSVQKTKDSALTTLGKGIGSGITGGFRSIMRTADISSLQSTYSSPNMTRDEADRLLQDAEYTAHFLRKKEMAETAEDIKHEWAYDLGNAVGSMIQFVGLGLATGSTAAIGLAAGVQAKSTLEEGLVDTFIEKTGGIEGYTLKDKATDSLLSTAYGAFTGITEQILGVEKLATGAINGLTKANALSRLARMQGKLGKSALIKYGSRLGQAAIGEGAEEFIQSLGEDAAVALAGYADTLTTDEVLKKAFTSAMYGALIGGPVGMGLYRYNRKSIIDRINKWSEEKELGLTEQQVVNMADEMLDSSRSTIVDEVATRAEIKNQYGKAYETLKTRIGEQIDATGTTPWTDQNKSREEYIDAVAMTVTLPAVVQANRAGLPLSEFLDTANIQVINNVLHFEPVADINQLQTMLEQQNDIIAEQNRLAKLNNDDPAAKQNAQRRKAILENAIRGMQLKNGIQTAARTRRKAQADYITAQQLAPEQMGTIDTAVEAQEGQEYVLFGGKKIPVEYQVVELADLQPSHINGTVNPNYSNKELQNRASRGTVQDVADLREKGANITPERLLRGMTSAEGAPITNAQNEVIAGNGRTEIIRVAYENPETAARYRSALEKAGFSTEGMNQPVLIRKNTTMTPAEQVAAADISNISETSAFDEASQAKRDTQYLKDSETPLDFAAKLPMSERRGLMLNNGKWNMRKVQQRYEDALLSWICGNDTQLFEELVLNRGLTQKVIDVLTSNGATIYNLQETYPDTEIRQDIYNALVKMQRATRDNFLDMTQTIELDGHDPMIENTLVWGFLYTNRSGNNLILKNYATTLQENHQAVNNGADMFGNTVAPLSKKDAMIQALQAADEASAQMAADRGREYEGLFTETGEIKNPELAAAVASYQNQFAAQGEATLFQLPPELAEQAELAEEMARLDAENDPYEGETINNGEFVVFEPNQIKSTQNRGTFSKDTGNIYYQKGRGKPMGWYDPELQAIVLGKTWNETTIVHEFHHRYLEKIWGIYKQAQAGQKAVNQAWIEETEKLFEMLGIDPSQDEISVEQQEQFASMVEAYITGLGVEKPETQAFTDFLNWVPEKYKSILNIGYLDKDGNIKNPILDEQSVAFFNRWFGNPALPSLPTAPGAQRMVNPTDANGEIVPSTQKEMNNREKEWGQDSEEQNKADAQLWRAIGENTPTDMRAAVDAEEAIMKEEAKALPDDRVLPEEKKQTLRDRWFKTYQPDARERAAQMARKYVKENPEHARELAFADPEIETEYDAPVDRGMLIRAVMETTAKGSDEWYILDNNLAVVKSMSASTLSLSGDISHHAYLDAKREVENARELKAAVNYAGNTRGAMDKWNSDIRDFISKRVGKIIATESNSEERKLAIKAFIEEAKTKFSGNTTNAILNQLDLTGYTTKSQQAFIKWAEKQIKQAAHAHIDVKEQAELMKASIKAQLAMTEIDSAQQDVNGNFARATAAAKDLRHWQFVKDKMKKAYIGKWGRFGIFVDNLFGSYAPSAMLMSINTLFVANIPSTAINNSIVKSSAQAIYGKNAVDKTVIENEKKRIQQIFKASGMNLAQMEKPTSPSVLHGEKYMNTEQKKWYNFTFEILGWGDNLFRIPTFVDTLARIASKNANGDSAKATKLFREYAQINNASDEAKIARKQALAVANMGVFTQEGRLASNLNHIRSSINKLSRGLVGLGPDGYGLGNLLAPFLKTGANVVEMGIRGSIAPVIQITTWAKKMQGKEITDLDKIALRVDWKYFTYTAVAMALFAALSNDDDDWYMEPYQTGHRYDPNKPYDSIKIGNAWVKLDIFGPFAIPIRVAAKIIQRWEDGALTAIANGYGFGASEALRDLPLANQITDNSLSYMAKQPGKWATGFLYNQANKLVPAQLKSIARAGSRATDTELDVSAAGQTIERKFHRNYGFDGEELTTNDLINLFTNRLKWGEE